VQTKQLLASLPTWQARLKQCTDLLKDATVFPAEQLALAAESFYFKLAAATQYQPTGRFSGIISLVRVKDNYMNLGEDYGLTQVSDNEIGHRTNKPVVFWEPPPPPLALALS
jgi:fatty acid synthase